MVVFSLSSLFLRVICQQLNEAQIRHDIAASAAIRVDEALNSEYACLCCLQQFEIDRSNEVKTKIAVWEKLTRRSRHQRPGE
jgi:hypothetical protein